MQLKSHQKQETSESFLGLRVLPSHSALTSFLLYSDELFSAMTLKHFTAAVHSCFSAALAFIMVEWSAHWSENEMRRINSNGRWSGLIGEGSPSNGALRVRS
jgi:hypothetical protein